MLINSKDISTFGATLIEREFSNHEVVNVNDWLDGASAPIFLREYSRYKDIKMKLLFEGSSEQVLIDNMGKFLIEIKKSTIKFSDLNYFYDVHMEGTMEMDKVRNGAYMVEVKALAHKTYKAEKSSLYTNVVSGTLTIDGNMDTPLFVKVVPTANITTYTIKGISEEILTLKNLQVGHTYEIDGYTMRYLKAGANDIGNYNNFEFPVGKVGTTNLLFSSSQAKVTISWYPRYY